MPSSDGNRAERSPEPLGALRDAAERTRCRLRVGERGGGRAGAQRFRDAGRAHDDGEHRLLGGGGAGRRVDGDRDLVGGRADGRDEEHERGVDLRVVQHDRQRLLVARRVAEPSMSTGFATLASAGSSSRSRATVSSPSAGSSSPAASQASAARMPSPPAFVSTATRLPFRLRLRREQRRDVDQLLQRRGAHDAGLVEERVDAGLGARQRGRVRAGGALAGRGGAALQREDRLAPGDPPREPAEAARIPERLDVEEHDLGRLVLLPPLEQVVRGDVGLVPDRDEGGEPEPARVGGLEQREPSAPDWDEKPMLPLGAERAAKVAFRRGPATAMPRQFGPISRAPWARTSASSCSCRSTPSLPTSAKPAEMTTSARTPLRSASSAAASTCSPGTEITARSTGSGISATDGIAADAGDRRALGVDRIGGAGEVALRARCGRARRRSSRGAARRRRRRRCRLEERAQRRDDRGVVALLDAQLEPLGRARSGTRPRRRRSSSSRFSSKPARSKTPSIDRSRAAPRRRSARSRPRRRGRRAAPAAASRSLSPAPCRRRRRRTRQRPDRAAHVVADRDDALAVLVGERADERAPLGPVRVEQRLDELRPEIRKPVEATVEALARERAVEVEQRRRVRRRRRPQTQRSAVAKDHVDRFAGCCGHGSITPARRGRKRQRAGRKDPLAVRLPRVYARSRPTPYRASSPASAARPTRARHPA